MSVLRSRAVALCGVAVLALAGTAAQAAGTTAGTPVNNQATITYKVGGADQSTQSSTASFVVDKKVNLTVAEVGGTPTQTVAGATKQVTIFTVTNLTNDVQDFRLDSDQQSVSIPLLGTDDFNVNNMHVYVDKDGDGVYTEGTDTETFIDELQPDASKTVFIVADVPAGSNQTVAIVSLVAYAAAGGTANALGADLVATSLLTPDSPTTVDIVFADDGGLLDLARNGSRRDFDSYRISANLLSIAKTSRVISDPVNLLVNPRAIPGATMEYCLAVTNPSTTPATAITLTDQLPPNTTFVPGSITVGTPGTAGVCVLVGTSEDDNSTGADESDPYGGSFDGTDVKATIPSVAVLTPRSMSFRVTVN